MQEIHSGGKPLKSACVGIFLWFTGRAIQAAAKFDKELKKEFDVFLMISPFPGVVLA